MKETKQLLGIPHDYGKPQMVGALRPGREEAPNKSYLNHAEVGRTCLMAGFTTSNSHHKPFLAGGSTNHQAPAPQ